MTDKERDLRDRLMSGQNITAEEMRQAALTYLCLYDETRLDACELKHKVDQANIYFTSLRNMIPNGDL